LKQHIRRTDDGLKTNQKKKKL